MIIGFCGYPGVGKDTAAKILVEKYGFVRIAFADPLRECVFKLNPMVMYHGETYFLQHWIDKFGWDKCKTEIPEVRRLLQVFGTEVMRETVDPHIWVYLAKKKLYSKPVRDVVFTDVRFTNEANWLSDCGAKIYRIHREGCTPVNNHKSEEYNFGIAGEFINQGTLEQLESILCQTLDLKQKSN